MEAMVKLRLKHQWKIQMKKLETILLTKIQTKTQTRKKRPAVPWKETWEVIARLMEAWADLQKAEAWEVRPKAKDQVKAWEATTVWAATTAWIMILMRPKEV